MSIISIIENHDGNEENFLAGSSSDPEMVILERLNSKTQPENLNNDQNNDQNNVNLELQDEQEAYQYQFLTPGTSNTLGEGNWVKPPSDDDKKSSIDAIDYFIELDRCNLTSDLDDLQRPNQIEWIRTTEDPVNDND